MKPGSRKHGPPAPDPVTLLPPGFVADRAEAAARVERLLQYQFHDRGLLEEALTHKSFADAAASYQRLEFVGDAALGLAFANFLYLTNPTLGPGALTTLRAANVSTEKLARAAVRHDLYPLLRRNCPRLDLLVGQFIESVKQELMNDLGTAPYGGSVVKAPKVLADIVEAIAAAVYVDCKFDLEKLWKVTRWLFEPIITADTIDEQPLTKLHELCQRHGKVAQFKTWQKGGKTVINVFVGGELVGSGSSEQKVIAKLNAARDAVGKLLGGAKQQVLTTGVSDGSGVEVGELKECKLKLNEQCSRKHWPKPIFKATSQPLACSSMDLGACHGDGADARAPMLKEMEALVAFSRGTGRFSSGDVAETWQNKQSKALQNQLVGLEKEDGPAHERKFVYSVQVETQDYTFVTIGDPMSRVKDAESSAAQKMVEVLLKL